MNIFFLDYDPQIAAQSHCDKHVVKMCVEYAQILSTTHRILDGYKIRVKSKSGKRMIDKYNLDGEINEKLYQSSHVTHPSVKWCSDSHLHYQWLYKLYVNTCKEYKHRYNKDHGSSFLINFLSKNPKNISINSWSNPPRVMGAAPDIRDDNSIDNLEAYRRFYHTKQLNFKMNWTNREKPSWWVGNDFFVSQK